MDFHPALTSLWGFISHGTSLRIVAPKREEPGFIVFLFGHFGCGFALGALNPRAILSCPALAEKVSMVLEKTLRQRSSDADPEGGTKSVSTRAISVAVGGLRDTGLGH